MTVYRIPDREKRAEPFPGETQGQCDLKLVDARWLITILDDHSRYFTRSQTFKDGTAENVTWLLD